MVIFLFMCRDDKFGRSVHEEKDIAEDGEMLRPFRKMRK